MPKQIRYLLPVLLVCVMSLPGWALPKSMIMTTEMTANNAGQTVKVNAKMWYSNMKFRTEINSNVSMPSGANNASANSATVIVDVNNKVGYLLNQSAKTALKIDSTQLSQMTGGGVAAPQFTDPTMMSNPAQLRAEIKKQGGKAIGQQTLLGHKCTIWSIPSKQPVQTSSQGTMENVTFKLWLADDITVPLKVEVISPKRGTIASMNAKSLQVNVPVNNTLFQIPAGYKVTSLSEMFNNK